MRFVGILASLFISLLISAASAHAAARTADPLEFSNQFLDILEKDGAKPLADTLAEALDNRDAATALQSILNPIEKKKAKFRAIALDRNYGGAIRQIIVYQYMLTELYPFIYFRFVYKMTDTGWRLSHFSVDTENSQPFPAKYGID